MNFKAVIIGGGPAGSTAATLLQKNGIKTLLIEKELTTKYKVGESLLPSALNFLNLLGIKEKVSNHGFIKKRGAYLRWGKDPEPWSINFGELESSETHSYQVIRSEFDEILLENANESGVEVLRGAEVTNIEFSNEKIKNIKYKYKNKTYSVTAEYFIDATGQEGLLSTKYLKSRIFNSSFQNVAIWAYWDNYTPLEGRQAGNIITSATEDGWLWGIPLHNGKLSVGAVINKEKLKELRKQYSIEEIYQKSIDKCSVMPKHLAEAVLSSPLRTKKDYSYKSQILAKENYFLCGDAACFLDPVLSSGVHLAMMSGTLCASVITGVLKNQLSAEEGVHFYTNMYSNSYYRFMHFLSAFYNQNIGQSSYFCDAQKVTNTDCSIKDTKSAFLNLVTGIQDLNTIQSNEDMSNFLTEEVRKNLSWRKKSITTSSKINNREKEKIKSNNKLFNMIEGFNLNNLTDEVLGLSLRIFGSQLSFDRE